MERPTFKNEDKITATNEGIYRIWTNTSTSMVNLLSDTIISDGIHILRLKSLNDTGGMAVIGISEAEQTD